jgi:hypothetical protein
LSSPSSSPKRGEIWLVNFDPTIGAEIKKTRPAVVVSSDAVGRLPIKLVAPLTDWKTYYAANIWHVRIDPDSVNGLAKTPPWMPCKYEAWTNRGSFAGSEKSRKKCWKKLRWLSQPSLSIPNSPL